MNQDEQDYEVVRRFQRVAALWAAMSPEELVAKLKSAETPFWMFRGENNAAEAMLIAAMPVAEIPAAMKALLDTAPPTIHYELQQAVWAWMEEQGTKLLAAMDPAKREQLMAEGRETGLAIVERMLSKASGSRPQ